MMITNRVSVKDVKCYKRERVLTVSIRVDTLKKIPDKFVANITLSGIKEVR